MPTGVGNECLELVDAPVEIAEQCSVGHLQIPPKTCRTIQG
jgi:hypothetical protein